MPYLPSYFVGLDLGKRADFTALAIIEEPLWVPDEDALRRWQLPETVGTGWLSPATLPPEVVWKIRDHNYHEGRPTQPPLSLRHLERFPIGTKYPAIVRRVVALMQTPSLAGDAELIVDGTGVGAAVVDDFRLAGQPLRDVMITGGTVVAFEAPDRYKVPKRDLVGALGSLLEAGRLKMARALPEAATLADELLAFQVTTTEAANDRYEGRSGAHDDLVLAVAMGCWYRTWSCAFLDKANVGHAGGVAWAD